MCFFVVFSHTDIPHCDTKNTTTVRQYSLAINESLILHCPIHSNPPPTDFRWSWQDEDSANYDSDSSDYKITPKHDDDFGQLSCWAKNSLGEQSKRCNFMIIQAKPPDSLVECRAINRTTTSFAVECHQSNLHDSQPPETPTFHALLYTSRRSQNDPNSKTSKNNENLSKQNENDERGEEEDEDEDLESGNIERERIEEYENVLQNLTSKNGCRFQLNNLKPGTSYFVELWASNRRGNSSRVRLAVDTMRTHNTKLSKFAIPFSLNSIWNLYKLKSFDNFLISFIVYSIPQQFITGNRS